MEQQLTGEQAYLQMILEKFNVDAEDPSLNEVEKILLNKIKEVQQTVAQITEEIEKLRAEVKERQEKEGGLLQQIIHKQGQSQGYVDSLLALRK